MTILVQDQLAGPTPSQPLTTFSANWGNWMQNSPTYNTSNTVLMIDPYGTYNPTLGTQATHMPGALYLAGPPMPAEYWVEVELGAVQGGGFQGVVLQGSETSTGGTGYIWAMTSNANSSVRLLAGSWASNLNPPGLPSAYAAGDRIRFGITGSGTSTVLHYLRGIAGAEPVEIVTASITNLINVIPPGGRAGIFSWAGPIPRLKNFKVGDYLTGPLPPTPPTGPQGAFTLRTT